MSGRFYTWKTHFLGCLIHQITFKSSLHIHTLFIMLHGQRNSLVGREKLPSSYFQKLFKMLQKV